MVNQRKNAAPAAGLRPRRQAQRGAAVFIVVMVLTLLTAVGIFAVRSASLADVAAGYDREASQASLIAQYATTTTVAWLGTTAGNSMVNPKGMPSSTMCTSNKGQNLPCFKTGSALLETWTFQASGEDLFETSSSSLNANTKPTTDADFQLEITEGSKTGQLTMGNQTSSVQMTVTVIAQVRPAGACVNGVGTTWNAGQQMVRSYISAGSL